MDEHCNMRIHVGDLVEVLADDPKHQFWYGEVTNTQPPAVNYISKVKDEDIWRFDDIAYEVDVECINFVVHKKDRVLAWRELGFVYRGDHEIIHEDDVDSDEDDEEYVPSNDEDEADEGTEGEDDETDSDDEPVEKDADYDDDLAETGGETDPGSTDDEADDPPPKARKKK